MTDKVHVSTNDGKIKGIKKTSTFSGTEYYSFLGIPYAQPTTGNSRFKDPVRTKPWKNTLDATTERSGCRQFSLLRRGFTGSEDCLYNNIHTPELPEENKPLKSVIVCIHPGGYFYGSPEPTQFGSPEYIIHHDIVYVCVSFRLHILGFLNLGLPECSGNQGLKDIIMSLEWVRDNISVFGGDPNDVTLLGSSSGSSLAHFLMTAPKAKGLFHKAVLMGMYNMSPVIVNPNENIAVALEMAQRLGYKNGTAEDRKKLLLFLKKIPIDAVILLRSETANNKSKLPLYPASPFLTTSYEGEGSIIPVYPDNLIPSTSRIPIMVGFCEHEAAMVFLNIFKNNLESQFYSSLTQNVWAWGSKLTEEDLQIIRQKAEQFYLNGESTETAILSAKCEIQTDISLSDLYESLINVVAEDLPSSVFVYRFNYEGSIPTMKERIKGQLDVPLKGTFHGDDYSYWAMVKEFWGTVEYNLQPKTREMVEKFTKLITTFVKTGDPNYEGLEVHWKPSSVENPCYLSIDDPLTVVEGKLNGKRMEFWEEIKKQFSKR